ncbi:trypsin-like serine peptidase [Herbidospora sp. RD11066]
MTPVLTALTLALSSLSPAAVSPPDVVHHVAAAAPVGYWTPQRMAKALPIGLLEVVKKLTSGSAPERRRQAAPAQARRAAPTASARWQSGGLVGRAAGRVFLTMDGVDFVCSAGSVRSANRDVVVTAGHCVKDGTGAWARNWVFVPGYDEGARPLGTFSARRMFVAGPWSRAADDSYDVGMVALNQQLGRHVNDVAGALEIGFGVKRGQQTHGFGYPADPPYDGERLMYCAGAARPDPHSQTHDQGLRCDLTAGASGGPWLSGFDAASGRGTVTSVSSFKYSDDNSMMYGPYFGSAAKQVFDMAEKA